MKKKVKGIVRDGNVNKICDRCGNLYLGRSTSKHCLDCGYALYLENKRRRWAEKKKNKD